MRIQEALWVGGRFLKEREIPSWKLDARVLLSAVTSLDRTGLVLKGDLSLEAEQQEHYHKLLERRAAGEPAAYLIGHKEFMGLDFKVTPAVLIPRPDTELMVEMALACLKESQERLPVVVDVGTGSGAVAVSLAYLLPELRVHAVDLSEQALAVARENALRHGVEKRVSFYAGNLLDPVDEKLQQNIHLITANLPYIPTTDIPGLMADVRNFEPHLALDGGVDGLELYRRLLPKASKYLAPGGHLLMEIGPGQGQEAINILPLKYWVAEIYRDLAHRERLVVARKL
ncbi:peptide chain release factor N(5)-glutamine methyltransferase [Desulforamulus ruminis]|uniref:Release factor glutamine methyltransferase n=1 Tax=Desulforamulus ruminis (strain ATCC 23193 / DSM 2154 / NCIMB 8452 / DL) TaxID=696281 RepID=F6DP76_DESRL|nr:peptide chain release factor N(5)-glutamine methyltransferase [Desulforamulus ruminis]AEG61905.1 protein-(glutamine-N5) methyltransferase, release factor-specific [Desulforamulus ruminis DSM 2154]